MNIQIKHLNFIQAPFLVTIDSWRGRPKCLKFYCKEEKQSLGKNILRVEEC